MHKRWISFKNWMNKKKYAKVVTTKLNDPYYTEKTA